MIAKEEEGCMWHRAKPKKGLMARVGGKTYAQKKRGEISQEQIGIKIEGVG